MDPLHDGRRLPTDDIQETEVDFDEEIEELDELEEEDELLRFVCRNKLRCAPHEFYD